MAFTTDKQKIEMTKFSTLEEWLDTQYQEYREYLSNLNEGFFNRTIFASKEKKAEMKRNYDQAEKELNSIIKSIPILKIIPQKFFVVLNITDSQLKNQIKKYNQFLDVMENNFIGMFSRHEYEFATYLFNFYLKSGKIKGRDAVIYNAATKDYYQRFDLEKFTSKGEEYLQNCINCINCEKSAGCVGCKNCKNCFNCYYLTNHYNEKGISNI